MQFEVLPSGSIIWLGKYTERPKPGVYTYRPKKGNRSLDQNAMYRARCRTIADFNGNTVSQIHEIIMSRCGFEIELRLAKSIELVRKSSADLDTVQFSKLMDEQDEIVRDLNEGLHPDEWLTLEKWIEK